MEGKGEENGNKGRREGKGLCMSLVSMGGISLIRVLSMIILKKKKKTSFNHRVVTLVAYKLERKFTLVWKT